MDAITGYDLLRDIIIIILAVGGIFSMLLYVIFRMIAERFKESTVKDTESIVKENYNNIMAMIHANVYGFDFWTDYKATGKIEYLNRAIDRTKWAYDEYASKLDEKKPDNEKLICWIKNNWAFYLAERQKCKEPQKGDDVLALKLAEEAYEKIGKFPEHAEAWIDTYQFVRKQFKYLYLFNWNSVPGDDNEKLIGFLRDDFDIDWAENSKISKSRDGMTISISKDEYSAEIMIDEKKKKAILKISDDITHELKVKKENDKLNIYNSPLNKR